MTRRTTPLVGHKAWFGPRSFGWGWDPVSWEGWVSTAAWFVASLGLAGVNAPWPSVTVLVVGLLATCILKGTPPGGPTAAEHFFAQRRNAKRTPQMQERDRQLRRILEDEPSVTDVADRMQRFRPNRARKR